MGKYKRSRTMFRLGLIGLLALVVTNAGLVLAGAPSATDSNPSAPIWARALRLTDQTGHPTLLVVTSKDHPEAERLLVELVRGPEAAWARKEMYVVQLSADTYPDQLKTFKIEKAPAVVLYAKGNQGNPQAWVEARSMDTRFILGWLSALSPSLPKASPASDPTVVQAKGRPPVTERQSTTRPDASTPKGDQDVEKAQYTSGQAQPSSQGNPPPRPYYPPPPPPYTPPPAPYQPPVAAYPNYAIPAPAPITIAPPSAPVYVQQQPATIVVGAAPPPNIVIASAPSQAPNVTYAPAPQPAGAPAPPNLFMAPAPAPAPAPAGQPVYMMPAAPAPAPAPAPAGQPIYMVAAAPQPAAAPMMTVTNPSLLNRMIGTLGEHLAQKKNPRIQMASAPVMTSPAPAPYGSAPSQGNVYALAASPYGQTPPQAYGYAPAPAGPYGPYPPYCPPGYPAYAPPPPGYGSQGPSPQHESPQGLPPLPAKSNP